MRGLDGPRLTAFRRTMLLNILVYAEIRRGGNIRKIASIMGHVTSECLYVEKYKSASLLGKMYKSDALAKLLRRFRSSSSIKVLAICNGILNSFYLLPYSIL